MNIVMTSLPRWIVAAGVVTIFYWVRPSLTSNVDCHGGMAGVVFNHSIFLTWRPERLPWLEAKKNCRSKGGSLVSIKTGTLNRFIFNNFFRQTVLKTPSWQRMGEFSSARRKPPTRSGLSRDFHKYEAWVNGVKTLTLDKLFDWFWVGDSTFGFRRFGTGFSDNKKWNCLSVKPGFVQKTNHTARSYGLFWYGSNCRTALPYICQFVTSRQMRMETSKLSVQRIKNPSRSNASHQGLLGRTWHSVAYVVAFLVAYCLSKVMTL